MTRRLRLVLLLLLGLAAVALPVGYTLWQDHHRFPPVWRTYD